MSFLGEDTLSLGELAEYIVGQAKEQTSSGSETESSEATGSEDTLVSEADVSPKDAEKFITSSLQTILGMTAADMENFG